MDSAGDSAIEDDPDVESRDILYGYPAQHDDPRNGGEGNDDVDGSKPISHEVGDYTPWDADAVYNQ